MVKIKISYEEEHSDIYNKIYEKEGELAKEEEKAKYVKKVMDFLNYLDRVSSQIPYLDEVDEIQAVYEKWVNYIESEGEFKPHAFKIGSFKSREILLSEIETGEIDKQTQNKLEKAVKEVLKWKNKKSQFMN